jgi:hypothetical protein
MSEKEVFLKSFVKILKSFEEFFEKVVVFELNFKF